MTTFRDIQKAIRAGIVVVDPDTAVPQRVIVMQFNPDSLERTIQPQAAGGTAELIMMPPSVPEVVAMTAGRR